MKERYAVTELRKQANRMNFADVNINIYGYVTLYNHLI